MVAGVFGMNMANASLTAAGYGWFTLVVVLKTLGGIITVAAFLGWARWKRLMFIPNPAV
jgi:hypothetical protein